MREVETFRKHIDGFDAPKRVAAAIEFFGSGRIVLASSFSLEDQVITDMLLRADAHARIFTLDTGRLFQETYDTWQATQQRYGVHIEVYAPESADIAELVSREGPNLFYSSVENRKRCCEIRKLRPLKKVLGTVDAWICGLRQEQSVTRDVLTVVEEDRAHGLIKINPLIDWSEDDLWRYIRENKVPYNRLFDQGFRSVGCAPCTRAVNPGDDVRAGRWWWESPEHKECGLHTRERQMSGASLP